MNKPMYIILHGTDCCGFPEINYGNMNKPFLKWVLKLSYKYASKLLPVSNSLVYTENNYYSTNKTIKQGFKYFFPSNKTAYSVLHNGININFWRITNLKERDSKKFITVLSPGQFVRKGGELIINTALKLPNHQFIFIGINIPNDVKSIPKNVVFIPRTPPEKLLEMYNEAKYYLQLSIFEGFGVALCEAMACGCIPIVSNANVLPDIVGDSGYVLNNRNKELFIKLLKSIENEDNQSLSLKARQRIINNFTVESRKELLLKIIEQ
jgi:glycosyltransferase involved in cell wall biosynthesis